MNYTLTDGVDMSDKYPDEFLIPTDEDKATIKPGMFVKVTVSFNKPGGERIWIKVKKIKGDNIWGTVANNTEFPDILKCGDKIEFEKRHVINIEH